MDAMIVDIPCIKKQILWYNDDYTVIIGKNGVGKTVLLGEMMCWCSTQNIPYAHYDADTALHNVDTFINAADDIDVVMACRMMSTISSDFARDIANWSRVFNNGSPCDIDDPTMLRQVLHMAGNGYMRLYIMTVIAIRNPAASYYFIDLPETSLHMLLVQNMISYLMHNFRHMKFVFATHCPELVSSLYLSEDGEKENRHVIHLPEDFLENITV